MEPELPPQPGKSIMPSNRTTNRHGNHITRRLRDAEVIIPTPTRVAKPVTVNTTPEQARQAAEIAALAFKPVVPAPILSADSEDSGLQIPDQTLPQNIPRHKQARLAITVVIVLLVLAAIVGAAAYYAAQHSN